MNRRLIFTALVAFALAFTLTSDISIMAAPELLSPNGAGRAPTIPIFPPVD